MHSSADGNRVPDTADTPFPPSPLAAGPLLMPITCRMSLFELDGFWYASVMDGVACFCAWRGTTGATVLLVFDTDGIMHVQARPFGGREVSAAEFQMIRAEVSLSASLPVLPRRSASRAFH